MNSDFYEQVKLILTKRRTQAMRENDDRITEINHRIPQIREINNQLYNTGRELIKIISGGSQPFTNEKIEQLKAYNLSAQAMSRQMLVQNGYPEDYLDIHYTCPKCHDTGYCNGEYCDCFKKLYGKISADALNKKAHLLPSSFDTFSLSYYKGDDYFTMERILNFTRNYAETFTPESESIFMLGKTGLGKTHLSLAIANKVLEKGYTVIYDSIINILRNIEREHFSREHNTETIDLIMETELLILDDLGTEFESTFYSSTIYNIINTRLNYGRPTIISTNLDYSGIRRRYDERVVSRISAVYTCMEFKGEDVRFQIKRKESQKL
ncbi:MAG: ATP-binding protein [Ruminococcus sp.]|nr:ATP-binding protein [Ruminococcus sp.]